MKISWDMNKIISMSILKRKRKIVTLNTKILDHEEEFDESKSEKMTLITHSVKQCSDKGGKYLSKTLEIMIIKRMTYNVYTVQGYMAEIGLKAHNRQQLYLAELSQRPKLQQPPSIIRTRKEVGQKPKFLTLFFYIILFIYLYLFEY